MNREKTIKEEARVSMFNGGRISMFDFDDDERRYFCVNEKLYSFWFSSARIIR